MMDSQRNYELGRIADEARYANEYREYQDKVREYEEAYPNKNQQNAMKHYYRWPQPPQKR